MLLLFSVPIHPIQHLRLLMALDVGNARPARFNAILALWSEVSAMNKKMAAIVLIGFSSVFAMDSAAQSRGAQRTQVMMAGTGHTDLSSTLTELDRVSRATQNDIQNLHVEKWKSGWKSGFRKDGTHRDQAQQAAGSLQRNLSGALPGLIHDVQSSRGGISATFKLYDDVSLVCEALDSLISSSEAAGKKSDATPLVDDYSALTRVRRALSNYIQQSASAWETGGKKPYASFTTPSQPSQQMNSSSSTQVVTDQGVKKIIVDDTVPEKKTAPAPKKKPVTFSNL